MGVLHIADTDDYRPGQPVEELAGFDRSLSGEDVCPGFELDLRKLLSA